MLMPEGEECNAAMACVVQRQKPTLKTWQYQTLDPWFRINRWHTLSSYRHEACRHEPSAPRDSLDIAIKAEYDHHYQWLKSKAEVLLQRDTLNKSHESVTACLLFWLHAASTTPFRA